MSGAVLDIAHGKEPFGRPVAGIRNFQRPGGPAAHGRLGIGKAGFFQRHILPGKLLHPAVERKIYCHLLNAFFGRIAFFFESRIAEGGQIFQRLRFCSDVGDPVCASYDVCSVVKLKAGLCADVGQPVVLLADHKQPSVFIPAVQDSGKLEQISRRGSHIFSSMVFIGPVIARQLHLHQLKRLIDQLITAFHLAGPPGASGPAEPFLIKGN